MKETVKKIALVKTNLFVCTVIILGFAVTSLISYHSNQGLFKQETENVSNLTAEGIYHKIESIFTKPVSISLTMANDSLLKQFLSEEAERKDEKEYIAILQNYLRTYKDKYGYDSAFLVSAETNRYYNFNGVDRVLFPDNPENEWYFSQLDSNQEYYLNIDNDEVATADNDITVFINCKIRDEQGKVMGVVGVGFRVNYIQSIFRDYEERYHIKAFLVDDDGTIEISTSQTGYEKTELFSDIGYAQLKEQVLEGKEEIHTFWYSGGGKKGYLVTQYIPALSWHLIVERGTTVEQKEIQQEICIGAFIVILVIILVLYTINKIIHRYNNEVVRLAIEKEKKHSGVFQLETEKIYENIYEVDLTHNRVASEATEQYFKSLGVPEDTPFDKALYIIAEKQIKEEYRKGYINTFSPKNILKAYEEGKESLCYDFMISNDGGQSYYWMRITARIFYWDEDKSVRMFVYRQNVDEEKKYAKQLMEKMELDSLTGLYNKAATQYHIQRALEEAPDRIYAFFIIDIDNFKQVNDNCGHAFGDLVISGFANILRRQFRSGDIVGRIGGDEFVAFITVPSREWATDKARSLIQELHHEFSDQSARWKTSASIGIAFAPEDGKIFDVLYQNSDKALYHAKEKGKDGFALFGDK